MHCAFNEGKTFKKRTLDTKAKVNLIHTCIYEIEKAYFTMANYTIVNFTQKDLFFPLYYVNSVSNNISFFFLKPI